MDERQWNATTDVAALVHWLGTTSTPRKLRLYLCAGLRRISHLLFSRYSLNHVAVAERMADGLASEAEIRHARYIAEAPTFGYSFEESFWKSHPDLERHTLITLVQMGALSETVLSDGEWVVNETVRDRLLFASVLVFASLWNADSLVNHPFLHSHIERLRDDWPDRWLVDCIFGNPFWPVTVNPAWLAWNSEIVPTLARRIYDEKAFDLMPILGNALEDAGCLNKAMLDHCRSSVRHARGCWVVDSLLGMK